MNKIIDSINIWLQEVGSSEGMQRFYEDFIAVSPDFNQESAVGALCIVIMYFGALFLKAYARDTMLAAGSTLLPMVKFIFIIEMLLLFKLEPVAYMGPILACTYVISLIFVIAIEHEPSEKNPWRLGNYRGSQEYAKKHKVYGFFAKYRLIAGNRPILDKTGLKA